MLKVISMTFASMSTELNGSSDAICVKPIIQSPDDKQAATSFTQFVVPTRSVTHRILVTSHVALHLLNRLKKKIKQSPGPRTYGQNFGQVGKEISANRKHSIGQKKSQKLNNAGKLRGMYHIDPEDKEFNDPPESTRITLNCAWTPQCHVSCERQQGIPSKRRLRTHKTKFALSSGMERKLAKTTRRKTKQIMFQK